MTRIARIAQWESILLITERPEVRLLVRALECVGECQWNYIDCKSRCRGFDSRQSLHKCGAEIVAQLVERVTCFTPICRQQTKRPLSEFKERETVGKSPVCRKPRRPAPCGPQIWGRGGSPTHPGNLSVNADETTLVNPKDAGSNPAGTSMVP